MSALELEEVLLKKPAISAALKLLESKLPASLFYHVPSHTRDVIHEAILFASHDNKTSREIELLAVAAAYHDTGFVESVKENEILGAQLARDAMKQSKEYTDEEIALVHSMIIDTTVRMTDRGLCQIPTTPLARYLLDADVSNLGREDFIEKSELVRRENQIWDHQKFLSGLIKFLEAHQWYTPAAQKLRSEGKLQNIEKVRALIQTQST